MHFLYSGVFHFGADTEGQELSLDYLLEFLRVSDEYLLEEVKLECEKRLVSMLNEDNVEVITEVAERFNAEKLREHCQWFRRRYGLQVLEEQQ